MREVSLYRVILAPIVTEKSNLLANTLRQNVFKVVKTASKYEIKIAIETLFKVNVTAVRTSHVKGKQRGRGGRKGLRQDWKKAVVQLAPGQDINFSEIAE